MRYTCPENKHFQVYLDITVADFDDIPAEDPCEYYLDNDNEEDYF